MALYAAYLVYSTRGIAIDEINDHWELSVTFVIVMLTVVFGFLYVKSKPTTDAGDRYLVLSSAVTVVIAAFGGFIFSHTSLHISKRVVPTTVGGTQ